MFKYLGLALVLLSWLAGGYLVTKWRDKQLQTISKHAASNKEATKLFAGMLIGCGILFYIWLLLWFVPHLELNMVFVAILTITIVCQMLTALAPDTTGGSRKLHRLAAYTMAVLYLPLAVLITVSPELSVAGKVVCSLGVLYMSATFVLVVLLGKLKNRYLKLQVLYIMVFQVLILVAAYL